MPEITEEVILNFEKKIYLPMLIKVLEMDLVQIYKMPLKFNRPYIRIVEKALQEIKKDLKLLDIYLMRNNMRIVRSHVDKEISSYLFISLGQEFRKEYINKQLQINSEELLLKYFISP